MASFESLRKLSSYNINSHPTRSVNINILDGDSTLTNFALWYAFLLPKTGTANGSGRNFCAIIITQSNLLKQHMRQYVFFRAKARGIFLSLFVSNLQKLIEFRVFSNANLRYWTIRVRSQMIQTSLRARFPAAWTPTTSPSQNRSVGTVADSSASGYI